MMQMKTFQLLDIQKKEEIEALNSFHFFCCTPKQIDMNMEKASCHFHKKKKKKKKIPGSGIRKYLMILQKIQIKQKS